MHFAFGGDGCGMEHDDDENYKTLNTVEIYDPVRKTTPLSQIKMQQARRNHKVIVYKDKLFVFGGFCNGYLNTVEMYSPDTNKFISMAPMKIARSLFACCRVGNLVYCFGGVTDYGRTNSVEIYNLDTNAWSEGKNFPVAKSFLHACAVNKKLK